ncbi:MAG TPA: hypothetical protein VN903_25520 [Polyangia bacterium]|nr:hypothetical protein [Polyangia bacterium]
MQQPRYKMTTDRNGLRRRLAERNQQEIDAARAAGDFQRVELLTLRSLNYPAYVELMQRRAAMEHAASVAGVPLTERISA